MAPDLAAVYPNPKYKRPSWEAVKEKLDTLGTARQKLVYLKAILVADEQEAEIRPERYWGFSESEESVSGWERGMAGGLEEFSDDDLAYFSEVTERWRSDVKKGIAHYEEVLLIEGDRQEDAGSEGRPVRVFWPGTQTEFGIWLYLTYQSFLSHTGSLHEPKVDLTDLIRAACALFYRRGKGDEKTDFSFDTLNSNVAGYATDAKKVDPVIAKLNKTAESLTGSVSGS